jgi:hypothetical protein
MVFPGLKATVARNPRRGTPRMTARRVVNDPLGTGSPSLWARTRGHPEPLAQA